MRSSSTLPPLQALRAFEAVARLLSFRRAGEELLISQSAVSHHIAALERDLGVKLFTRKARGVELTSEGERYLGAVRHAFELIAAGTREIRGRSAKAQVRVSLLPSFAANWLVPRLARFTDAHPEIDLALDPTLRLACLGAGEADIAIRYGDGLWRDGETRLLMTERLAPVASPALVRCAPGSLAPREVLNHTLLLALRRYEWDLWSGANGVSLAGARTIQLSDYNIVIQAALDGQGIAIGRLLQIADRLRNGALIRPCAGYVTSPRIGHWIMTPKGSHPTGPAAAFVDWLVQEAAIAVRQWDAAAAEERDKTGAAPAT